MSAISAAFIAGRTERKLAQVAAAVEAQGGRAIPIMADATSEDRKVSMWRMC